MHEEAREIVFRVHFVLLQVDREGEEREGVNPVPEVMDMYVVGLPVPVPVVLSLLYL